jgi:hypothetical protein
MSQGAFSDQVADLKGRLLFLGILAPPVDKWFDDKTEAAVKVYQGTVGHQANGTVDETLWAQLATDTDAWGYSVEQAQSGAYDSYFAPTEITEYAPPAATDTGQGAPAVADTPQAAELRNVLRDLSTRVKALAGDHARAIDSACKHFVEDYAKRRVKELDQRITGEDYGKYLARHITGMAGVGITRLLGAGVAATGVGAAGTFVITSIWIGFSMAAERRVGSAVHDALSDRADFEAAMARLVMIVPDQVDAATDELKQRLDAEIDAIFEQLNRQEPLDAATTAWVTALLTAGPTETDAVIEYMFGIPTDKESVRLGVYQMLVEAFEQMVLDKFDTPTLLEQITTPLIQDFSPGVDVQADAQRARERDHAARAHQAALEAAKRQRRQ